MSHILLFEGINNDHSNWKVACLYTMSPCIPVPATDKPIYPPFEAAKSKHAEPPQLLAFKPDTDGTRADAVGVPVIVNDAPVILPLVTILPVDDIEH